MNHDNFVGGWRKTVKMSIKSTKSWFEVARGCKFTLFTDYINVKKEHSVFFIFYSKNFLRLTWWELKGTLMQIWKSPYIFLFIWKYFPENFAFLILRILELYTRKVREMFVYKHTETIEYVKK